MDTSNWSLVDGIIWAANHMDALEELGIPLRLPDEVEDGRAIWHGTVRLPARTLQHVTPVVDVAPLHGGARFSVYELADGCPELLLVERRYADRLAIVWPAADAVVDRHFFETTMAWEATLGAGLRMLTKRSSR